MEPTTPNTTDSSQETNQSQTIASQPQMQTPFSSEEKSNTAIKAFVGILVIALLAGIGYWFWMSSQNTVSNDAENTSEELSAEDAALQSELNAVAEINNTSELNAIDEEF